jgi:hypothetical protein
LTIPTIPYVDVEASMLPRFVRIKSLAVFTLRYYHVVWKSRLIIVLQYRFLDDNY